MSVRNRAAIIGVGETEFSRNAGRSNLRLALEAITAALDDAGLTPRDVDAIVKMHANTDLFEIDIMRSLGIPNLRFFSEIPHGGGGPSARSCTRRRRSPPGRPMSWSASARSGARCGRADARGRAATSRTACSTASPSASSPRRNGWRCSRDATCTTTTSAPRRSASAPSRSATTARSTRTRCSTGARSASRTTNARAGSRSRCGCSTAASRLTAAAPSSSFRRRRQGSWRRADVRSARRCSSPAPPRAPAAAPSR